MVFYADVTTWIRRVPARSPFDDTRSIACEKPYVPNLSIAEICYIAIGKMSIFRKIMTFAISSLKQYFSLFVSHFDGRYECIFPAAANQKQIKRRVISVYVTIPQYNKIYS